MGIQDVDQGAVTQAITQANESQNQSNAVGMQSQSNYEAQSTQNKSSGDQNSADILNLDGVLKFKLGEREWTPDQLRKSILMHSDYTKKTQALAEKQKYWDNLDADLDSVRGNPQLIQAFLQTYPKEFHKYLRGNGNEQAQQDRQDQTQSQQNLPPELLSEISGIKSYIQEQQIKAHEAQIDAKFATLQRKYPEGDEDVVLARAQALIDKGTHITDKVWEKLWKESHERYVSRYDARQKTTLNNQRTSNQSARGPASGGGTPAQAPQTKMSMKEATEYAVRTLSGKG